MSDVMRTLRDQARQVQKLQKDLRPPTLSRRDWNDDVFARQTLGDEVEIELWYLAEHFLLAWHDWHGLRERFPRYFGEPERPFPAAWRRLDADCTALAGQLLRDKQLDEFVSTYWLTTGTVRGDRQRELPSTREVYQTIVQNHRRWSLMRDAETGRLERHAAMAEKSAPQGEIWPQCRKLAVGLNARARSDWDRLGVLGQDLLFHLRHYRHANLLVSWLADEQSASAGEGLSGLLHLLMSERIVMPSIEDYLGQLQDPDARGTAARVAERVTQAIGEIGYEEFVEDLTSADFRGGPDSLVGASAINLIPSATRGPCQLLLLAVSKGDKKALGFPAIMRQVREHLIRCSVTKSVIVVCDHWHPTILDEHLGDLRAHHDRGVRFLFLMVGIPGRVVGPVGVDLGLTP